MKKLIFIILTMVLLTGCMPRGISDEVDDAATVRYHDMIKLIDSYVNFAESSAYFDLSGDISKIDGGYRYYVFIDHARIAMYDIEAMAIEKGVDYGNTMTANIGIFENREYNMIPNQSAVDLGYVEGMSISGTTQNADPVLFILVQWKNKSGSMTNREYFRLSLSYEGEE